MPKKLVSDLKPKHRTRLFPSLGYLDTDGRCRALVHGRVFVDGETPVSTKLLLRGLKRSMHVPVEEFSTETFQRRVEGFLAAPGKRRRIVLEVGGNRYRLLRRTRKNGGFLGTLLLPETISQSLAEASQSAEIPYRIVRSDPENPTLETRHQHGVIHFTPPTGISVITDIDDTIKLTHATERQEMLANTFLRPFTAIEGMSSLYGGWKQRGWEFHYVSSSPWQLYDALADLCADSSFPSGSMHLRYFRVRDQMFKRLRRVRRHSKVEIISDILMRLPSRRFILVGDSGEKDPEVYRFVAKHFPDRIAAILIREVPQKLMAGKRLEKLLAVSRAVSPRYPEIVVFRDSDQLSDVADRFES